LLRIVLALFSGMFREGIGAIFDGIKNDRKHEQEIEFVDKWTSCSTKNRASVFRATLLKHRSVLALFNPKEKFSDI
jgi:hypothetical protein